MHKMINLFGAGALILSSGAYADNTVEFGDAVEGGIGYEWTVNISENGSLEYVGAVGGKSSWEPEFTDPDRGWTHTSDWTSLTLESAKLVTIELYRQQGVTYSSTDRETGQVSTNTAGNCLHPVISVYKGIDTTTESEKGSFNPAGNFWSTLEFSNIAYDIAPDATKVMTTLILDAGEYSLNFGGSNGAIYTEDNAACFNGLHGFRAKISAQDVPPSL